MTAAPLLYLVASCDNSFLRFSRWRASTNIDAVCLAVCPEDWVACGGRQQFHHAAVFTSRLHRPLLFLQTRHCPDDPMLTLLLTLVPLRSCQAFPQAKHTAEDACRSQGCRLRHSCSRVPDCRSPRAGRSTFFILLSPLLRCIAPPKRILTIASERRQGPQGQAYHPQTSSACHSW